MSKRTAPIDWAEFRDSIGNDQLKLWQYRAACFVEDTDEVRLEIGRKCYEAVQASRRPGSRPRLGEGMSENKTKQSTYKTIGIRFASNPTKVYTYRVRSGAKLKLGDEVILDGCGGPAVGYVVRLDRTPQDNEGYDYKYVTRRVAPL